MIIRRMHPWRAKPFEQAAEMRREIQRLFDSYDRGATPRTSGVFPPINVTEDQDNYYVRAELPGITASEVELSAHHNTLEIAGERTLSPEGERASYHRRERVGGRFHRSVSLPADIETDGIEAGYADGILSVVVPKAVDQKPRQIAVKSS